MIFQLAAAECGCHNHENVLIISAPWACLCSPKSSRSDCCRISEQKQPQTLLACAELRSSVWRCLLRPAAQACTNRTPTPRNQENKTHSRGDLPLGCNLELSGPDFPFSINQDPGCCPFNVGKPGRVYGRFCQPARGWRRAQSWTRQSPPSKWKGSGPNRETQTATGPSSRRAGAAWPRSSEVSRDSLPTPVDRAQSPDGRDVSVTALPVGSQGGVGAQAGSGTTQGPRGSSRRAGPRAPHEPSTGRLDRSRHSNVSWNPWLKEVLKKQSPKQPKKICPH